MSGEPLKINGRELKFPVDWEFRVVVESARADAAREAIGKCLESHGIFSKVTEGLHSEGGRYRTLRATATLKDRETMNRLSTDLGKVDGVKFLL